MEKSFATYTLGGSEVEAARWMDVSIDIYRAWPERLHPYVTDRVIAAHMRRELAAARGLSSKAFFADCANEVLLESIMTRVSTALVMAGLMPRVPPELARIATDTPAANEPRKRGRPRLHPLADQQQSDEPQAASA